MWYSLKAQGEVVGRRKHSSLAQGRLETLARLKVYHPRTEMVNKVKELLPRKFLVVEFFYTSVFTMLLYSFVCIFTYIAPNHSHKTSSLSPTPPPPF